MEAPEKNMPVYKDNKTGTWYVSKRYQDWDGKERRLFKRNFATKKEAKEYESSFISQKKGNPSIRFRDFIEIYYEDRRQNTKPSTFLTKKNVQSLQKFQVGFQKTVSSVDSVHSYVLMQQFVHSC